MSITISRVKGMKLKAEVDGFTIITGQIDETIPAEGPSPGRLMVASLGLCAEFYAALYLKKHKISDEGLIVEIKETNGQNPSRAISFEIKVKVKAVLTDEQRSGIMNNVRHCYVSNTMKGNPEINYCLLVES
jgi:uncharacterized OsmC-like protein